MEGHGESEGGQRCEEACIKLNTLSEDTEKEKDGEAEDLNPFGADRDISACPCVKGLVFLIPINPFL